MVQDKEVLSIITFSKNIYENENDTHNVTLVIADGKEINDHNACLNLVVPNFWLNGPSKA